MEIKKLNLKGEIEMDSIQLKKLKKLIEEERNKQYAEFPQIIEIKGKIEKLIADATRDIKKSYVEDSSKILELLDVNNPNGIIAYLNRNIYLYRDLSMVIIKILQRGKHIKNILGNCSSILDSICIIDNVDDDIREICNKKVNSNEASLIPSNYLRLNKIAMLLLLTIQLIQDVQDKILILAKEKDFVKENEVQSLYDFEVKSCYWCRDVGRILTDIFQQFTSNEKIKIERNVKND